MIRAVNSVLTLTCGKPTLESIITFWPRISRIRSSTNSAGTMDFVGAGVFFFGIGIRYQKFNGNDNGDNYKSTMEYGCLTNARLLDRHGQTNKKPLFTIKPSINPSTNQRLSTCFS